MDTIPGWLIATLSMERGNVSSDVTPSGGNTFQLVAYGLQSYHGYVWGEEMTTEILDVRKYFINKIINQMFGYWWKAGYIGILL